MLPIFWRDSARNDLREIITHIAQENPPAARRMKIRLEAVLPPLSILTCIAKATVFPAYVRSWRTQTTSFCIGLPLTASRL